MLPAMFLEILLSAGDFLCLGLLVSADPKVVKSHFNDDTNYSAKIF